MSDIIDEEWMCPDDLYYKMFAATGGFDIGTSSMEMQESMQQYLEEWVSSGGTSSGEFSSESFIKFGK